MFQGIGNRENWIHKGISRHGTFELKLLEGGTLGVYGHTENQAVSRQFNIALTLKTHSVISTFFK